MKPVKIAYAAYLILSSWTPVKLKASWVAAGHLSITIFVLAVLPWSSYQVKILEFAAWILIVIANAMQFRASPTPKRHIALILAILASPSVVSTVDAEQVYDCSSTQTTVATYSLGEVGQCPDFEHMYRNKTLIRAQILQRSGGQLIKGYQCQLTYRREACHCGFASQRKFI